MNNEETRRAQRLADQAKDRERMIRILEEEKKTTTRRNDVKQADAPVPPKNIRL